MIEGYYYIHTNGELIYKPSPDAIIDIRESDFCIGAWPIDSRDREMCWNVLVEVMSTGLVSNKRIAALAVHWACNDTDADMYAPRVGCKLSRDGDMWHATRMDYTNPMESPEGFGATKLEAMANLCKALGYKPAKMWGSSFKDLLK